MGVKCKVPNTEFVSAAFAEKLLLIGAGDNVVRLLPPLIVSDEDISVAAIVSTKPAAHLNRRPLEASR